MARLLGEEGQHDEPEVAVPDHSAAAERAAGTTPQGTAKRAAGEGRAAETAASCGMVLMTVTVSMVMHGLLLTLYRKMHLIPYSRLVKIYLTSCRP